MEHFTLRHHKERGYGVYTKKSWKKGEKLFRYEGNIVPTYMAGVNNSITLNKHFSFEWRKGSIYGYLNHSCKPNCYVDLLDGTPTLVALQDISSDGELCYNYNAIEVDLSKDWIAFTCHCHQENCIGYIKGFMYLTPKQELEILDICSPYVKELREEYEKQREQYWEGQC